ncbi:MAG: hypothetical protein HDQ88_02840 [Clostridia bacterium]|nr:hypothetical protein [Clostridia bacterium]
MTPTLEFKPYEKNKSDNFYGQSQRLDDVADIRNRILRISKRHEDLSIYYFDSDYVYRKMSTKTGLPVPNGLVWCPPNYGYLQDNPNIISGYARPRIPRSFGNTNLNRHCLYQAISKLRPGDTIDTLIKYYNTRTEHTYNEWLLMHRFHERDMSDTNTVLLMAKVSPEVYKFVLKIDKPQIEREYGNNNTHTFDFIRIQVAIPTTWPTDKKKFTREHIREINRAALLKLKHSRSWQAFDLPVNILRLTECIITQQSEIELLYEIKRIGGQA